MAEIIKELGRIPVSRGDYQSTTEYYKDNIVQYKRGSYQVVSESPIIGVPPTNDKNVVNPGWTLFAGTLDAQDVVNQIKEQEAKSIQAVAAREAEILAKSDAAEVSFDNTGISISGTNVQDALKETNGKLSKLESEMSIINLHRLEGYDNTSSFTLESAIAAFPASKKFVAKGMTYLDADKKVHIAIFNSNAYGSGWTNTDNWIDLSEQYFEDIRSLSTNKMGIVSSRGYIDFANASGKMILPSAIYYNDNGLTLDIAAGEYAMDMSANNSLYCILSIDKTTRTLVFRDLPYITNSDIPIAIVIKASSNTIASVVFSILPYRIDGKNAVIELQSEVERIKKKAMKVGVTYTEGGYVSKTNGLIVENDYYLYTDFLPIDNTKPLKLKGQQGTHVALCAFYDADKRFISAFEHDNGVIEVEVAATSIPANAVYVRSTSNKDIADAYVEVADFLPSQHIKAEMGELFSIHGYIRKADGLVADSDYYICTDFLPIDNTQPIRVKGQQATSIAVCVFYDADKKYISAYNAASGIVDAEIPSESIPTNARYIRCSANPDIKGYGVSNARLSLAGMLSYVNEVQESTISKDSVEEYQERYKRASVYESKTKTREQELRALYKESGEEAAWYGVEWSEGSDPNNVTAIGKESLHQSLPIQSKMRRCVVKNGIVQYYLNADNSELKEDGSNAVLDGTDGNVMVEIPEFFYRCEESGSGDSRTLRVMLSEQGLDGFLFSPMRYTSAYEATIDREKNVLASVCTTNFVRETLEVKTESNTYIEGTAQSRGVHEIARRNGFTANASKYRGGTNDASYDNANDPTISSNTAPSSHKFALNQLGIPASNLNRNDVRDFCDAENGIMGYQYDTHRILWMLTIVEFKTRDIQSSILGAGASVFPSYAGYEAFFKAGDVPRGIACLPCGVTNSLGNKSGFVYYKMQDVPVDAVGTFPYTDIAWNRWGNVWMPVMSYRGIENYYGHLYKIADQVTCHIEDTGTYAEGHEGDYNYKIMNVTYYYQKNPYLTDNSLKESQKLGLYSFACQTRDIRSILWSDFGHVLPINSGYDSPRGYHYYCDTCEMDMQHINTYTTFNGRIVSGEMVGSNFIVAVDAISGVSSRPSDGTRLDIL